MRAALSVVLGLVVALVLAVNVQAEEEKEKKGKALTGKITCAKCDCKLEGVTECATVLVIKGKKKGDKPTFLFFDADSHKKYHKDICKKGKMGTVTGTVSEEGGKKVIMVKSLKYKEEK
jgi:hypothetical protein